KRLTSIGLVSLGLVLGGFALAPRPALADKVILKSGRVVEGQIIEETATTVKVKRKYGDETLDRSEIAEIVKEESADDRYGKAIAGAKTAQELVDLAKKAKDEKLPKIAEKALAAALKLDPENQAAHDAQGDKKVDGKWLPEAEWKKKEGWTK